MLQRLAEQIIHAEQNTLGLREALKENNDNEDFLGPIIYMVEELNPNGISAPHDYPKLANQLKEWGIAPEIDENQSTTFTREIIGNLFQVAEDHQHSSSSDGEVSDSQDKLLWDEDRQKFSFFEDSQRSSESAVYFDEDADIKSLSNPFTDETDEVQSVSQDEYTYSTSSSEEETSDDEEGLSHEARTAMSSASHYRLYMDPAEDNAGGNAEEVRAYPIRITPNLITIDDRTGTKPSKSGRLTP